MYQQNPYHHRLLFLTHTQVQMVHEMSVRVLRTFTYQFVYIVPIACSSIYAYNKRRTLSYA